MSIKQMKRPRTKEMLMPYINENNDGICLGGFQKNIAKEILVDQPEALLNLLKFMNGNHTLEEITDTFKMDISDLEEILDLLSDNGVLYENNSNVYSFSEEEIEYYSRNLNFFAWVDTAGLYYNYWEVQEKLKNSKVLVLGAGGTGGASASSLARLGVGNITVLDYDCVEYSNLNRQIYFFEDVGKLKVDALQEHLERINPFIKINKINKLINNLTDLTELGSDFDLVLCCIDKPANINEIMEEYTVATEIPRILGGYASTVLTNSIFTKTSVSYENLFNKSLDNNYDAIQVNQNLHNWSWNNAVISTVAYTSGNFSALYAFYYITNLKRLENGVISHIDLFNIQNQYFSYLINEEGKKVVFQND